MSNFSLIPRAPMKIARKSHGFCYLEGYLYAIGGFNSKIGALDSCEKYDIEGDKWI
jgi:hypothetical protein